MTIDTFPHLVRQQFPNARRCGLAADWQADAYLVSAGQPNLGRGYYVIDDEHGSAELVYRDFDRDDDGAIKEIARGRICASTMMRFAMMLRGAIR